MNIGIDFDNTIARYDALLAEVALEKGLVDKSWNGKGKTELRDHLRRQPEGETSWMKLQGRIYGKYMYRAQLMPGVANFFLKCKLQGHKVFIVSHKTEFGHFDPERISLRQEALKWMEAKGFFDPMYFSIDRENVFFADTRYEKVNKVAELQCDWFIDDLPEVFAEDSFPECTQKVLFGQFDNTCLSNSVVPINNWSEVCSYVLGAATDQDVVLWSNLVLNDTVASVKKIVGRGNSRIYRLMMDSGSRMALKHYPDRLSDSRPRLQTEYCALSFLSEKSINSVPKVIEKDEDLNIGLYEWIEGHPVIDPTLVDLRQALEFIKELHQLVGEIDEEDFPRASEACLSAVDLIRQVEKRLNELAAVKEDYGDLYFFLEQIFIPMWKKVKEQSYSNWPVESRERHLPRKKQTLSPSDFGFHNVLKEDGKITFIDFDYFGWDDPVKLTADFLWHPAMVLKPQISAEWIKGMMQHFSVDPEFKKRLCAAMPLYGMRWAMIVLNEFLPGFAERRRNAGETDSYDMDCARRAQLQKAKRYCERVKNQDIVNSIH
ncbi:aminoglycoside phosphotransferase family protein [Pseudomonadota bacterium]